MDNSIFQPSKKEQILSGQYPITKLQDEGQGILSKQGFNDAYAKTNALFTGLKQGLQDNLAPIFKTPEAVKAQKQAEEIFKPKQQTTNSLEATKLTEQIKQMGRDLIAGFPITKAIANIQGGMPVIQGYLKAISDPEKEVQIATEKSQGLVNEIGLTPTQEQDLINSSTMAVMSFAGGLEKVGGKAIKPILGGVKKVGGVPEVPPEFTQTLRGTKGLTADQITQKYPDIILKREVPATDIYGNKVKIPEGEALTPYELKGNKVLLQDGETYIVSKNQFQNIKGNAVSGEAKPFASELKGTEETILGGKIKDTPKVIPGDANSLEASNNFLRTKVTKFSQYQLPGGKNYKEVLIKAPSKNDFTFIAEKKSVPSEKPWIVKKSNDPSFIKEFNSEYEAKTYVKNHQEYQVKDFQKTNFKSSHWDEPNVVSHLRLNERTYKGKKVTFMEEMQSDWAREGRSKGFAPDRQPQKLTPAEEAELKVLMKDARSTSGFYNTPEGIRAEALLEKQKPNSVTGGVPNNPLLKNWQELSVKRALKEAVDNNSEYLAWTTGEQQAARYNLSQEIDNLKWTKLENSTNKRITLNPKSGNEIHIEVNKDGKVVKSTESKFEGKHISESIGKGISEKILAEPKGNLSGEGLNIGGEWAKNLYDKQVKNIVEDITEHKVEVIDMGLPIDKAGMEWRLSNKANEVNNIVKPSDLKVGLKVYSYSTGGQADYIITDILGDGKFKAVPKADTFKFSERGGLSERELNDAYKVQGNLWAKASPETFDISTKKSTGQQAIKITPEIRAMVKGEALTMPKASGQLFNQTTKGAKEIKSIFKPFEAFGGAKINVLLTGLGLGGLFIGSRIASNLTDLNRQKEIEKAIRDKITQNDFSKNTMEAIGIIQDEQTRKELQDLFTDKSTDWNKKEYIRLKEETDKKFPKPMFK